MNLQSIARSAARYVVDSAVRPAGDFVQDIMTPTVRLGVTGLSRSGKTVFITALIHNLTEGGWLAFFEPVAQGRVLSVQLSPPHPNIDLFNYHNYIQKLTASPPTWPERTNSISELRLIVTYQARDGIRALLGPQKLIVDIVDYPGEWLLDLPLMGLSYRRWSDQSLELARRPERRALAGEFLSFVEKLSPGARFSTDIAPRGAAIFRDYLRACRDDAHALSTLPPGRILEPGSDREKPLMNFFPVPTATEPTVEFTGRDSAAYPAIPGITLEDQLGEWYEAYKATYVIPFFRDHIARIDRQIVLIDMLKALNAGPSAVGDLERALGDILATYRPGRGGFWSRLFAPRADRVLFAATKADHLHSDDHERLQRVMARVVQNAMGSAEAKGAEVATLALASVRATRQATVNRKGTSLACIAGTPSSGETIDGKTYDGKTEAVIFPGTLPDDAEDAMATAQNIRFLRFQPPPLAVPENAAARGENFDGQRPKDFAEDLSLPHIQLDRALQFLLADKLA